MNPTHPKTDTQTDQTPATPSHAQGARAAQRVRPAPTPEPTAPTPPTGAPAIVPVTVKRRQAQIASTAHALPSWAGLSFIQTRRTRYGLECTDWLAVPDQTHGEGWATGLKVVAELLAYAQTTRASVCGIHHGIEYAVQEVMAAAGAVLATPEATHRAKGGSKHGAAGAVLHCMARLVLSADMVNMGGNRCAPVAQWLRCEVQRQTQCNEQVAQIEARDRAAWAQKMQTARRAKQAARQQVQPLQEVAA